MLWRGLKTIYSLITVMRNLRRNQTGKILVRIYADDIFPHFMTKNHVLTGSLHIHTPLGSFLKALIIKLNNQHALMSSLINIIQPEELSMEDKHKKICQLHFGLPVTGTKGCKSS